MGKGALAKPVALGEEVSNAVLAFRGYNITNLGRSEELLRHDAYAPIVRRYLAEAGEVCAEIAGKRVDLIRRIYRKREPSLRSYAESIALIVAMELAQLQILEEIHGIDARRAQFSFGYSLGELTALAYGGLFPMADVLRIPLSMSKDCAELAKDVTMGILFSRGPALPEDQITRLCLKINSRCHGLLGISSILSPNTVLLLGQGNTMAEFGQVMHEVLERSVHLRINPHRWPPLHTPIMWQRNIPDRSALMMQRILARQHYPKPPVVSLAKYGARYNDVNAREMLQRWVDRPQRLWTALCEVLASGAQTVIHVGPEPNLIPATFKRLSDNVQQQVSRRSLGSLGLRAVSGMVRRPWLAALLPSRTVLLRAPEVRHVILEDWLLAQKLP